MLSRINTITTQAFFSAIVLIVFALFHVGFFQLIIQATSHHHIMECPYMEEGSGLCNISVEELLQLWQQSKFVHMASLALIVFLAVQFGYWIQLKLNKQHVQVRALPPWIASYFRKIEVLYKLFNTWYYIIAQGIMHPRIYSI